MGKKNWEYIAGPEEEAQALRLHCERRGRVTPLMRPVIDFLNQFKVSPDLKYPKHRGHLSGDEWKTITNFVFWRWDYKTCRLPIPCLSYWAKQLCISAYHLGYIVHYLADQGLLRILEWKNGHKLEFSLDVLHQKVNEWLDSQREEEKAADQEWQDFQAEEAQPELAGPEEEEEEESLPEPIAAFQPAPEWDMALAGIVKERGPSASVNLFGIRAYWMDGKLVVRAKDRRQWNLLDSSYKRIFQRHLSGYNWVMPCPARSA